ncbi:hypothetical protein SAMN05216421_1674 [Halopseudomonas xinjiangensis]|uniref:Uncharacterized protein n=1 Tax=Halopseudomonas xinjiangensis TaxID=487184 RepID=A0A1H1SVW1_9GAMM|nr:hypothetical protein SAMN05216421_1674 [Halopseudomonas xinjiangensis]
MFVSAQSTELFASGGPIANATDHVIPAPLAIQLKDVEGSGGGTVI